MKKIIKVTTQTILALLAIPTAIYILIMGITLCVFVSRLAIKHACYLHLIHPLSEACQDNAQEEVSK